MAPLVRDNSKRPFCQFETKSKAFLRSISIYPTATKMVNRGEQESSDDLGTRRSLRARRRYRECEL